MEGRLCYMITTVLKETANKITVNKLTVGEHTIHAEIVSNSDLVERTFLLVHDRGLTGRTMHPLASKLLTTFDDIRVVIVDLPYHGKSETGREPSAVTHGELEEVMQNLLAALVVQEVIVGTLHYVGWGVGGALGIYLASEGATLIKELTLVNTIPSKVGWKTRIKSADDLTENLHKHLATETDAYRKTITPEMEHLVSGNETVEAVYFESQPLAYDYVELLASVHAKTLIFSGSDDVFGGTQVQMDLRGAITNAEIVLLKDDNHTLLKPFSVNYLTEVLKRYL